MLIIPAIDLKDGCVIRFVQGKLDKKVYSKDPVKTAKHWVRQGASLIHIVDLDGAISGIPKNIAIAKQIAKEIDKPVQFGGGVREIKIIDELLNAGVYRVILGTKAVQDKAFLKKAYAKHKNKLIISLDLKGENVLIKGWQKDSESINAYDFISILQEIGFNEAIYTDILKDGTLKGPNLKTVKKLLKETKMRLIASGGVSSLEDIAKLRLLEKQGLTGVIVGKALYEGRFTLTEALKYS